MGMLQSPVSTNEFPDHRLAVPEHELLIAVLDRAVLDYYSKRTALSGPAKEWLFEGYSDGQMFSFDWICEHLDLEPQAVRSRVEDLNLSAEFAQSHRWLRRKVQSGERVRTPKASHPGQSGPRAHNDDDNQLVAA